MSYNISFRSSVYRDLKKIDKAQAEQILNRIEQDLSENPASFTSLAGKFASLRKYRVGYYRIIYSILEDIVLILRISHLKVVL